MKASLRDTLNPFYVAPASEHQGRPRITFSRREMLHLAGAVTLLTLCFTAARNWQPGDLLASLVPDPLDLLGGLLAFGCGFILHELAHKVVAQRYGHWAEFRAAFTNLLLSYAVVLGTGFFFAAPGAVVIQGPVTRRQGGLISLVGPATNFLLALAAWPLSWATDADAPVPKVLGLVAYVNAMLCVFNLLPFGPLDGKKVLHWNVFAYGTAMAVAVALFIAVAVGPDQLVAWTRPT